MLPSLPHQTDKEHPWAEQKGGCFWRVLPIDATQIAEQVGESPGRPAVVLAADLTSRYWSYKRDGRQLATPKSWKSNSTKPETVEECRELQQIVLPTEPRLLIYLVLLNSYAEWTQAYSSTISQEPMFSYTNPCHDPVNKSPWEKPPNQPLWYEFT